MDGQTGSEANLQPLFLQHGLQPQGGYLGMDEAVLEEVRAVVAEQLDVAKSAVNVDSSFEEDLRADSLTLVELLMALEEKFELPDIPEEEAEKIRTVADVVRYVEAHKGGG
jgi:acyl carrier protein